MNYTRLSEGTHAHSIHTHMHTCTCPPPLLSSMSSIYFSESVVYCVPGIIILTPHLHVSHNFFFPLLICSSRLPWKRFKETALNCLVHKEKQMLPWKPRKIWPILPIVLTIRPHPAPGYISLTEGREDKPCVVSVLEVILGAE